MRHADYRDRGIESRLSVAELWSLPGIEIVSTTWQRDRHPERSEGSAPWAAIEIMRAGAFEKRVGRERLLADPALVLFHDADERFDIRHPVGQANHGTTIRLDRPLRFRRRCAPSASSLVLAVHRLATGVARGADPLRCDEEAVELACAALVLDAGEQPRPNASAQRRARVVQAFLNESYAQPLRLADVARAADCSAWHVSRQFRQATGTSVHAWLLRLRLRHALEALRQGAQDLTGLALDVGFSSHSHLTAAFRAEFGLTPSAFRAEAQDPASRR